MWTQTVDLHSHSTKSDGAHPIAYVAGLMASNGVKIWSLTDHDTTEGWKEAYDEANRVGMTFVAGIEITCQPEIDAQPATLTERGQERASASWHVLAFFPDWTPTKVHPRVEAFKAWLEPYRSGRGPRMERMVERLRQLGMPLNADEIRAKAEGSVGRPHLAQSMVDAGYVSSIREAFDVWIGDGLPGFVPHCKPRLAEVAQVVHEAGGILSLAHPWYYGVDTPTLLRCLQNHDIEAVEAFHRSHPDWYRYELSEACPNFGLKCTVGSDFHTEEEGHRPGHMPAIAALLPEQLPS